LPLGVLLIIPFVFLRPKYPSIGGCLSRQKCEYAASAFAELLLPSTSLFLEKKINGTPSNRSHASV